MGHSLTAGRRFACRSGLWKQSAGTSCNEWSLISAQSMADATLLNVSILNFSLPTCRFARYPLQGRSGAGHSGSSASERWFERGCC
jgi:hypothetical protein